GSQSVDCRLRADDVVRRERLAMGVASFEIASLRFAAVSGGIFFPALATMWLSESRALCACLRARAAFFPDPAATGSFLRTSLTSFESLFRVDFLMLAEASS